MEGVALNIGSVWITGTHNTARGRHSSQRVTVCERGMLNNLLTDLKAVSLPESEASKRYRTLVSFMRL